MKECPILFSAPMVRAIQDGTKTQTRRICKGQRELSNIHDFQLDRCPYGKPADRLWVRETWGDRTKGSDIMAGTHWDKPLYRSDADAYGLIGHDGEGPIYVEDILWRPSIHMPRWASRISLEITGIRVERLQDINEEDAIAEGCLKYPFEDDHAYTFYKNDRTGHATYTGAYRKLWESINGKGSWSLNPFVWVVEFRKIQK